MEDGKKKIILKLTFTALVLFLAGTIVYLLDFQNIRAKIFGPVVFESLEPDKIKTGLIVDISIDTNFGAYMEEYKEYAYEYAYALGSGKTTNVYYVIWTGDAYAEYYKYMGIKVPVSEEAAMDEIAEATLNDKYIEPVKYIGVVHRMTIEESQYFKEYFQEGGWTDEEIEEYTIPYYIEVGNVDEGDNSVLYIFLAIWMVPFILAIWIKNWN